MAQRYIEKAHPAEISDIQNYMTSLGFTQIDEWTYKADKIIISDLKPKNVLQDSDGDLYVIDAEIKSEKNV